MPSTPVPSGDFIEKNCSMPANTCRTFYIKKQAVVPVVILKIGFHLLIRLLFSKEDVSESFYPSEADI